MAEVIPAPGRGDFFAGVGVAEADGGTVTITVSAGMGTTVVGNVVNVVAAGGTVTVGTGVLIIGRAVLLYTVCSIRKFSLSGALGFSAFTEYERRPV